MRKKLQCRGYFKSEGVPRCECGGIIKPDVVLYGENLDDRTVTGALAAIESCDTLIIGGTSLTVYPAAGFIRYFSGRNLVLLICLPLLMTAGQTLPYTIRSERCLTK